MSAKILTLEQVQHLTTGDCVFVEVWGKLNRQARFLCYNKKRNTVNFSVDLYHVGRGGRYSRRYSCWCPAYNCSYRCWDKEPSTEEMLQAPEWEYPRE